VNAFLRSFFNRYAILKRLIAGIMAVSFLASDISAYAARTPSYLAPRSFFRDGYDEKLKVCIKDLENDDEQVRILAITKLSKMRDELARKPLIDLLKNRNALKLKEYEVEAIQLVLENLDGGKRYEEIFLTAEDPLQRLRAAMTPAELGNRGNRRAVNTLLIAFIDKVIDYPTGSIAGRALLTLDQSVFDLMDEDRFIANDGKGIADQLRDRFLWAGNIRKHRGEFNDLISQDAENEKGVFLDLALRLWRRITPQSDRELSKVTQALTVYGSGLPAGEKEKFDSWLQRYNKTLSASQMFRQPPVKGAAQPTTDEQLQEILSGVKDLPPHIEIIDIANQGAVCRIGSVTVFKDGIHQTDEDARYRLEDAPEAQDTADIITILRRRYLFPGAQNIPDLVILDGGYGPIKELLSGKEKYKGVYDELKKAGIQILCLAKASADKPDERIYTQKNILAASGATQVPVAFTPDQNGPVFARIKAMRNTAHENGNGYTGILYDRLKGLFQEAFGKRENEEAAERGMEIEGKLKKILGIHYDDTAKKILVERHVPEKGGREEPVLKELTLDEVTRETFGRFLLGLYEERFYWQSVPLPDFHTLLRNIASVKFDPNDKNIDHALRNIARVFKKADNPVLKAMIEGLEEIFKEPALPAFLAKLSRDDNRLLWDSALSICGRGGDKRIDFIKLVISQEDTTGERLVLLATVDAISNLSGEIWLPSDLSSLDAIRAAVTQESVRLLAKASEVPPDAIAGLRKEYLWETVRELADASVAERAEKLSRLGKLTDRKAIAAQCKDAIERLSPLFADKKADEFEELIVSMFEADAFPDVRVEIAKDIAQRQPKPAPDPATLLRDVAHACAEARLTDDTRNRLLTPLSWHLLRTLDEREAVRVIEEAAATVHEAQGRTLLNELLQYFSLPVQAPVAPPVRSVFLLPDPLVQVTKDIDKILQGEPDNLDAAIKTLENLYKIEHLRNPTDEEKSALKNRLTRYLETLLSRDQDASLDVLTRLTGEAQRLEGASGGGNTALSVIIKELCEKVFLDAAAARKTSDIAERKYVEDIIKKSGGKLAALYPFFWNAPAEFAEMVCRRWPEGGSLEPAGIARVLREEMFKGETRYHVPSTIAEAAPAIKALFGCPFIEMLDEEGTGILQTRIERYLLNVFSRKEAKPGYETGLLKEVNQIISDCRRMQETPNDAVCGMITDTVKRYEDAINATFLWLKDDTTLTVYQKRAILDLSDKDRAILADEFGLGKTLEALGAVREAFSKKAENGVSGAAAERSPPTVILTKATTLDSWKAEILGKMNDVTEDDVLVIKGDLDEKLELLRSAHTRPCKYIIISDDWVARNKAAPMIWELNNRIRPYAIIVDEAHRLQDEDSLRTQALTQLKAEKLLLVTATPLKGKTTESLDAMLNWLMPGFPRESDPVRMHALLRKVMIRRVKKELKDSFSEVIRKQEPVDMGVWSAYYDAVVRLFSEKKESEKALDLGAKVNELNKASIHPALISTRTRIELERKHSKSVPDPFPLPFIITEKGDKDDKVDYEELAIIIADKLNRNEHVVVSCLHKNVAAKLKTELEKIKSLSGAIVEDEKDLTKGKVLLTTHLTGSKGLGLLNDSPKIQKIIELVKEEKARGRKAVIFSKSRPAIDIVNKLLAEQGLAPLLFKEGQDGSYIEEEFRTGKYDVLCTTYQKGAESLNLETAATVIKLDFPWEPTDNLQAENRVHRLTQKELVKIVELIAKDTLDETIRREVLKKMEIFAATVDADILERDDAETNDRMQLRMREFTYKTFDTQHRRMEAGDLSVRDDRSFAETFADKYRQLPEALAFQGAIDEMLKKLGADAVYEGGTGPFVVGNFFSGPGKLMDALENHQEEKPVRDIINKRKWDIVEIEPSRHMRRIAEGKSVPPAYSGIRREFSGFTAAEPGTAKDETWGGRAYDLIVTDGLHLIPDRKRDDRVTLTGRMWAAYKMVEKLKLGGSVAVVWPGDVPPEIMDLFIKVFHMECEVKDVGPDGRKLLIGKKMQSFEYTLQELDLEIYPFMPAVTVSPQPTAQISGLLTLEDIDKLTPEDWKNKIDEIRAKKDNYIKEYGTAPDPLWLAEAVGVTIAVLGYAELILKHGSYDRIPFYEGAASEEQAGSEKRGGLRRIAAKKGEAAAALEESFWLQYITPATVRDIYNYHLKNKKEPPTFGDLKLYFKLICGGNDDVPCMLKIAKALKKTTRPKAEAEGKSESQAPAA